MIIYGFTPGIVLVDWGTNTGFWAYVHGVAFWVNEIGQSGTHPTKLITINNQSVTIGSAEQSVKGYPFVLYVEEQ